MERAYGPAHQVRKDKNEIKPLNDFLNNSEEDPLSFYGNKIYSMDFDLIEKIKSHYAGRPNVEEKEAFKQSIVEMYDGFIARARMISEIKFDQLMDKMMNGAPDGVDFSGAKKILERVFELHNINVKYLIDNRDANIYYLFTG
jgi:predicted SpoU family rRNA methylase